MGLRADIDLSGLPDTFVLKASGGAASRAVLPLERVGEDAFRMVSGTDGAHGQSGSTRLSYYDEHGALLDELTLAPGGKQLYRRAHDRMLGKLWEGAMTRMEVDLLRDRTAELIAATIPGAQSGRESDGLGPIGDDSVK